MEEKTAFREALGDSPVMRVLEFLIEGRNLDYSLTDIANNSGVGWTTLHRIWTGLEDNRIVEHTRVIGKAKLFRINTGSTIVKNLIRLYDTILKENAERNLVKQSVKVRNR